MTTQERKEAIKDVIIIGAGYSGLSAGLYFKDSNINNFTILEARDRVGGRVCTEYVKLDDGRKCYVDAGGAYVGPTQNRLLRLCHRFGIKTFHVNIKGKSILEYNHRISRYNGTIPMNLSIFTLFDLNHAMREIDKLAQDINTENVNKSNMNLELLKKYDNMTVDQWLINNISNKEAIEQFRGAFKAVCCVETCEVSMLFWINYVKNANGIKYLIETENGAQDSKIYGGSMGVCQAIQKYINKDCTNRIKLNHIVKCIEYKEKDKIVIHCENGIKLKTKYLLCCIAPALYNTIEWKPKLNWMRSSISTHFPMGYIIKTNTYYKTAWWRKDGLNGLSFNVNDDDKINKNPVIVTFDDCKPDGSFPSIMGFILADQARKYMQLTYQDRKELVLKQYQRIFKNEKAITECIGYFEKIWHEEKFSGGCYVGTTGCNVMTQSYWKILKQPENGNIFFGGTELADNWMGYMDGAIQSGEREANKIAKILKNDNHHIKLRQIYGPSDEPQCDNCPLPFVDLKPSWIESNLLPSAKNLKLCLLFVLLIIILFMIQLIQKV